ncbi:SEC22 [Auxenochlorella protothecoides x Auxenochlorella symbiontica]
MVKLTLIARVRDGQLLAEGLDGEKEEGMYAYKTQAKSLFKQFSTSKPPPRQSVASGDMVFHTLIDEYGVCYLTLTDKAYPKKLAYQYLEELQSEFSRMHGPQVDTVNRPYAFIKFDTFIQKTKKLYLDTRTQRNIAKLNQDIAEVHQIMTRNINDVLAQGERLDKMQEMSTLLSNDARQFAVKAKDLYHQALLRKYLPWLVTGGIVLLVLVLRLWLY